jgi:hypothetical protein
VCAYVAAILVACWLFHGLRPRSSKLAGIVLIGLLGANFGAIYVDNPNQLFGERSLVEFLQGTDEDIYIDPVTQRRALFLLENARLENRVRVGIPPADALYFYNPNRARELGKNDEDFKRYRPRQAGDLVWEKSESRKLSGVIIEWLGLKDALPESIYRRLNSPNPPVAVYRQR